MVDCIIFVISSLITIVIFLFCHLLAKVIHSWHIAAQKKEYTHFMLGE